MSKKPFIKTYSQGDLNVHWEPRKCFHSGKCVAALPNVFDPKRKPWIELEAAEAEAVIQAVDNCPSGALSWSKSSEAGDAEGAEKAAMAPDSAAGQSAAAVASIKPLPDGPLLVKGPVRITQADGAETLEEGSCALCRCGASQNKPYCDGSHSTIDFDSD